MWEWISNIGSSGASTSASSGLNVNSGAAGAGGVSGAATPTPQGAGATTAGGLVQPADTGATTASISGNAPRTEATQPISSSPPVQPAAQEGMQPDSLTAFTKLDQSTGYSPFGEAPTETKGATSPNVSETPGDELQNAAVDYLTGLSKEQITHAPSESGLGELNLSQPTPDTFQMTNQYGQRFGGPASRMPDAASAAQGYTPQTPMQSNAGTMPTDTLRDKLSRFAQSGRFEDFVDPNSPYRPYANFAGKVLDMAGSSGGGAPEPTSSYQPPPEIPQAGLVRAASPARDDVQRRYAALLATLRK